MVKIILNIEGMACGMCEAHVNDAIRKEFSVKKVSSSHSKGVTEIIAENEIDKDKLDTVIEKAGYKLLSVKLEPYEKKGFSLFKNRKG